MKKIIKAMMKFKRVSEYQFAIQKTTKGSEVKLLPVAKEPGSFSWRPIVKVYNEYLIFDYEHPIGLTQEECLDHIKQYQLQLKKKSIDSFQAVEYTEVNTEIPGSS